MYHCLHVWIKCLIMLKEWHWHFDFSSLSIVASIFTVFYFFTFFFLRFQSLLPNHQLIIFVRFAIIARMKSASLEWRRKRVAFCPIEWLKSLLIINFHECWRDDYIYRLITHFRTAFFSTNFSHIVQENGAPSNQNKMRTLSFSFENHCEIVSFSCSCYFSVHFTFFFFYFAQRFDWPYKSRSSWNAGLLETFDSILVDSFFLLKTIKKHAHAMSFFHRKSHFEMWANA